MIFHLTMPAKAICSSGLANTGSSSREQHSWGLSTNLIVPLAQYCISNSVTKYFFLLQHPTQFSHISLLSSYQYAQLHGIAGQLRLEVTSEGLKPNFHSKKGELGDQIMLLRAWPVCISKISSGNCTASLGNLFVPLLAYPRREKWPKTQRFVAMAFPQKHLDIYFQKLNACPQKSHTKQSIWCALDLAHGSVIFVWQLWGSVVNSRAVTKLHILCSAASAWHLSMSI